jgi:serine/threonine protein kinase
MEESLSQEHPSGDVSKDWMFSERDIVISDTVLGKGAFGEVRVAKWRNIDVAAKRLHGLVTEQDNDLDRLQFQNADIVDSFREEMVTLSKLRHPNLVLFLGVGYNPRNRQPTTILTELLSGSLYDLLEVHKIKLTLPEILDISLDVASGLEYLHSTNPQIVHRDISAKNILLGGNHAKIADLGQAKVFGSTALSRQTAMPGAMAYSAPEVLTGKYTAKIDIFSYGILLIQMCSGEYPRLDRREEQHKTAASKFSPLSQLLSQTIEYQPNDRPTASRVCEILREVRNNDRYYPPARRQPPQSDIGTLARRWLEETVESRCGDLRIALEQTSRRVHVEEQRWRDEAERVDKVFFELKELKEKVLTSAATITRRDQEITHLSQQITQLRHENEQKSQEIQSLLTEKDQLKSLLSNAQKKTGDLEVLVSVWRQEKEALKREQEEMRTQYSLAKQNEFSSKSSEHQLKFQLELQMDQCRELEMRLEQTLSRWRAEKEQVTAETERCTRLRETCVELVEKDQRRKEEIDRLMSRLSMYNSLPLPEEIKARFRDQERDIERLREEREEEREERRRCEKSLEELREEYEKMKKEREEEREEGRVMRKQMGVREERERHLEEMVDELDEEMQRKAKEISMLEREKKSLMEITDMVREELAAAKDEVLAANAARRRAELDRNPRGGGAAAAGGGGGRSQRSKRVPRQQQEQQQEQEQEGSVGGATHSDEDSDSHSSGEEEEEDEEEGRDLFAVTSPLLSPTRRPLSAAASASAGSTSASVSSSGRLEEISDPDTRQRILHDQEKLRRYSINTRLKKVRSGELGTAEANAIKENTATRFHSYGSGNFGDLVKSASSTHEHLLKLQDSQQRGEQEDPLERQREQDSQAKGRILAAGERGGVEKIIECIWEHLDVSTPVSLPLFPSSFSSSPVLSISLPLSSSSSSSSSSPVLSIPLSPPPPPPPPPPPLTTVAVAVAVSVSTQSGEELERYESSL